ncbi:MAG: hypothetical protein AB1Z22_03805 [Synechococcaceae cyanobacterium]
MNDRATLVRRLGLMGLDATLLALSFWLAFALRLNEPFSASFRDNLFLLPWAIGIGLAVLLSSDWYRGLTRYSGSHSLYTLLPRTGLMVLLLLLVNALSHQHPHPFRSFWPLFWFLGSVSLITSRIVLRDALRYWLAHRRLPRLPISLTGLSGQAGEASDPAASAQAPTVLFGAGMASHLLLAELRFQPRFQVVAVLDDDPSLWGRRLHGIPIHAPDHLPRLVARHQVQQVLLAIPAASRARRRQLVEWMRGLGLDVLSIPSLADLASGANTVVDLRPVQIEDLLGHDPSAADPALLAAPVRRRCVLVTGAGGSIGGEL